MSHEHVTYVTQRLLLFDAISLHVFKSFELADSC